MNHFVLRNGLPYSRIKFQQEKFGRVVCLGGSITFADGWREYIWEFFRRQFPGTQFDFINAGIGGTCSTLGAFRMTADVFKHGIVDLLFVDFAVNDEVKLPEEAVRAMEGIVRQAHRHHPQIDILFCYFLDHIKYDRIQKGLTCDIIAAHEKVAERYHIPSLDLARETTRRLRAGEFKWEDFFGDTCHPTAFGHRFYADVMERCLLSTWSVPEPLDLLNYENGRYLSTDKAEVISGWVNIPSWDHQEPRCNYTGAVDVLAAEIPGSELHLSFEGTVIGIYAIIGADTGGIEVCIDRGPWRKIDLYSNITRSTYLPVLYILASNLPRGNHELGLKISEDKNPLSRGHAVRIMKFAAN
jgi:lysophospholipase L1-like esterase